MSREGRRRLAAIVGAVAVAAVVCGVILVVMVRHTPEFSTVTEQPEPVLPGTIAYQTWEHVDGGYGYGTGCVVARAASGGVTTELACDALAGNLATTPDGRIQLITNTSTRSNIVLFDPTGAQPPERVVSQRASGEPSGPIVRDDGARVDVEGADGRYRVVVFNDGRSRTVLTLEGPDDYTVEGASWSPDGQWIVIGDSTSDGPRLLVARAEGEPQPRVLVDNAGLFPFAWSAAA